MEDGRFQEKLLAAASGGFSTGTFGVSKAAEQTSNSSRFASMYKMKVNQKDRAAAQLTKQKQKRFDSLNHCRCLTNADATEEEDEWEDEECAEPVPADSMEYASDKRRRWDGRKIGTWKYRNQLMNSEWLLDKPAEFREKWIMVPAPIGKRNLVIASGGETSSYAKNGIFISRFPSQLPGGNKHMHKWHTEAAILDCIYSEANKTYYVLDIMLWRQTPMYEAETEFRFYWMQNKFQEIPQVKELSNFNPFRFEVLPNFRCEDENILSVLDSDMNVPLDGLLFYHKETHYTFGYSPLVLWLKPHMIPEALEVTVPQKYLDQAPADYKGFEVFKQECIENLLAREAGEKARVEKRMERDQAREQEKLAVSGGTPDTYPTNSESTDTMET